MAMSFINKPNIDKPELDINKSSTFTRFSAMQPSVLTGGRDENTGLIRSGNDLLASALKPFPEISAMASLMMNKAPLFPEFVAKAAQSLGMTEQVAATPSSSPEPSKPGITQGL